MALYEMKYEDGMKISLSKGNKKIGKGIWSFATLPGYEYITTKTKGQLTNIHGTCKGCCDGCENGGCYAIRDAKLHHNVTISAWSKNTLIMRHDLDDGFKQISQALKDNKAKVLRFGTAGELDDKSWVDKLVWLANDNPNVIISFYTKRFAWIKEWVDEHGEFPDNLVCNMSKWLDNMKGYENIPGVNVFAYDSGEDEEIKDWVACPAVAKKHGAKKGYETGITCDKCMRCYRKGNTKTRVYNH